jgi:hypothetical protein
VNDRILLVPPIWAPDPAVVQKWPALHALLLKLPAFLPVDFFLWPTLRGQEVLGTGVECLLNAFRRQLRPEHHVLAQGSFGEVLLEVLAMQPAASLTMWGARLHEEAGGHELANKVIPFIQEVIAQREATAHT